MTLEDLGFSGVTALVLTYLWTKSLSAGVRVTDLPRIQRCHQPYAAENALTLKSIVRILWTSGGLSIDCIVQLVLWCPGWDTPTLLTYMTSDSFTRVLSTSSSRNAFA